MLHTFCSSLCTHYCIYCNYCNVYSLNSSHTDHSALFSFFFSFLLLLRLFPLHLFFSAFTALLFSSCFSFLLFLSSSLFHLFSLPSLYPLFYPTSIPTSSFHSSLSPRFLFLSIAALLHPPPLGTKVRQNIILRTQPKPTQAAAAVHSQPLVERCCDPRTPNDALCAARPFLVSCPPNFPLNFSMETAPTGRQHFALSAR